MLDIFIESWNWLSLTIPFFIAGGAFIFLREKLRAPTIIAAIAFLITLGAIWVGLYFLYPVIHFPLWMRWPHEWFD